MSTKPADESSEAPEELGKQGGSTDSAATDDVSFFEELWRQLGAVKLAITLLVLWAAGSIIGTVIPQESVLGTIASASDKFGDFWGPVVVKCQFFKVYQSVWYRGILILLSMNVVVCTVDRTRTAIRRMRRPKARTSVPAVKGMRSSGVVTSSLELAKATAGVGAALRKRGFRPIIEEHELGADIIGRRGVIKVLGPMVVHISLLLVFAGAIYGRSGMFGGFRDGAVIPVGEIHHEANSDQYVQLNDFQAPHRPDEYEGSTTPVDFISEVTLYEPVPEGTGDRSVWVYKDEDPHLVTPADSPEASGLGEMGAEKIDLSKVKDFTIRVNYPLKSKGVRFFQQSWGVLVDIVCTDEEGAESKALWILDGGTSPRRATATEFGVGPDPNRMFRLSMAQSGDNMATPVDGRLPIGPSLKLAIQGPSMHGGRDAETLDEWLTPSHPVMYKDVEFSIGRVTPFTGLEIKSDPGVGVVTFGFILGAVGLIIGFYIPFRQVRVKVTGLKEGGSRIVIGADAGVHNDSEAKAIIETVREAMKSS